MSEPYLSELKLVSFNFPPKGWAFCNGQLLAIAQNQALFSLLGTTYGGDGRTTFALPNLQSRVPIHMGGGFTLGERGGETAHTVTISELPAHPHVLMANNGPQNSSSPGGFLANTTGALAVYGPPASLQPMNPASLTNTGGSQPHENMSPYLVMNWIIALVGIFPSQN